MWQQNIRNSQYHIVVGAGYGDEGKGKTVALILKNNPRLSKYEARKLVVRFNGGPQAGHSVTYNGKTHIYSNYGAGTFINEFEADTYWSEFCTFNPLSIQREFNKAKETFGEIETQLYIDPEAMLITPYDTFANDSTIMTHGDLYSNSSCGSGHGSTVARNETPYKLTAFEYFTAPESILRAKLDSIRQYYSKIFHQDPIWNNYKPNLAELTESLIEARKNKRQYNYNLGSRNEFYGRITVFEGAQGTLLDQHYGVFPDVTRSNTTVKNALELIHKYGIPYRNINVYLATRCYHTRHGRGNIPNAEFIALKNTETEINQYNNHQGNFKTSVFESGIFNYAYHINQQEMTKMDRTIYTCTTTIVCNNLDQVSPRESNNVLSHLSWKYENHLIVGTNEVDIGKANWYMVHEPKY